MEPEEIAEFTKELQEGAERSLMHVSLIISVLAVLVALVTVLGHREHTEAVLAQARASDQWNEYQARRIRQSEVALAAEALQLAPTASSPAVQQQIATYKQRQARVQGQLKDDTDKAHEFEAEVAKSEHRASRFDLGEALLQISVVLASVTLLTRQHRYVWVALVLAFCGLIAAVSAGLVR